MNDNINAMFETTISSDTAHVSGSVHVTAIDLTDLVMSTTAPMGKRMGEVTGGSMATGEQTGAAATDGTTMSHKDDHTMPGFGTESTGGFGGKTDPFGMFTTPDAFFNQKPTVGFSSTPTHDGITQWETSVTLTSPPIMTTLSPYPTTATPPQTTVREQATTAVDGRTTHGEHMHSTGGEQRSTISDKETTHDHHEHSKHGRQMSTGDADWTTPGDHPHSTHGGHMSTTGDSMPTHGEHMHSTHGEEVSTTPAEMSTPGVSETYGE